MHLAAWYGHRKVVDMLMRFGANACACDEDGRTALHLAAQNGHVAVVGQLLSAFRNVAQKDRYGHTPLRSAALSGHTNVVTLLFGGDGWREKCGDCTTTGLITSVDWSSFDNTFMQGSTDASDYRNSGEMTTTIPTERQEISWQGLDISESELHSCYDIDPNFMRDDFSARARRDDVETHFLGVGGFGVVFKVFRTSIDKIDEQARHRLSNKVIVSYSGAMD